MRIKTTTLLIGMMAVAAVYMLFWISVMGSVNDAERLDMEALRRRHASYIQAIKDETAEISAKPFKLDDEVEILETGRHGVVHKLDVRFPTVSYADDVHRMLTAELLYSQVGPWKK